jgi:hypothetical protein
MDEIKNEGPAALVSVARAAHRTGDRDLERAARRLLLDSYGIRIAFARTQAKHLRAAGSSDGGRP